MTIHRYRDSRPARTREDQQPREPLGPEADAATRAHRHMHGFLNALLFGHLLTSQASGLFQGDKDKHAHRTIHFRGLNACDGRDPHDSERFSLDRHVRDRHELGVQ